MRRSFWGDPYLWVHLAGLAAVPIFLELCLLGLAVGDPILPGWFEIFLVGAIGIAPILWMQLQKPFSIYSLLLVALKPDQLSEDQRRLLGLFKSQRNQLVAIVTAILLLIILQRIYDASPLVTEVVPDLPGGHWGGLVVAAIAFFGANLFCQVPASVVSVMLHSDEAVAATPPYAIAQIPQTFLCFGWPVNQILPEIAISSSPEVSSRSQFVQAERSSPSTPTVAATSMTQDAIDESASDLADPLTDDVWDDAAPVSSPSSDARSSEAGSAEESHAEGLSEASSETEIAEAKPVEPVGESESQSVSETPSSEEHDAVIADVDRPDSGTPETSETSETPETSETQSNYS